MERKSKERKRNLPASFLRFYRGFYRAVYVPVPPGLIPLCHRFGIYSAPSNRATVNDEIFHRSAVESLSRTTRILLSSLCGRQRGVKFPVRYLTNYSSRPRVVGTNLSFFIVCHCLLYLYFDSFWVLFFFIFFYYYFYFFIFFFNANATRPVRGWSTYYVNSWQLRVRQGLNPWL